MRLLVIGARGYLGSHVRSRAEAAGMEVVTAGRTAHYHLDLADGPDRVAAVIAAAAPDAVVNCAGATAGPDLVAVNLTGTHALAQAMLRTGPGRLVHLGSAAEYGPAEVPVTERTPPRPTSLYGVTKLAGTRLVELAVAAGLDAAVLRVFNPVGPGAPLSSLPGRLAAELKAALRQGTDVRVGSLDAVRDFVDVRDVADAVVAAVRAPALPHPVLNIGGGRGMPVRSIVKHLIAISGYQGPVLENPVREDAPGPARSADVPWQQADITRAAEDLGWTPHRELASSLTDLWEASP